MIIIQKALGRENIDEVIKLSEEFKVESAYSSSVCFDSDITANYYPEVEMSGGRHDHGEVITEKRTEETIITPANHEETEITKTTTIERREVSPARTHPNPHIVTAERTEYIERGEPLPSGALTLVPVARSERDIRAEIKALEAEQEAIKLERKAERELRRADRLRREGRDDTELVLYEKEEFREERSERSERGGVRIEKDKKGRMSISIPKAR